MSDLEEREPSQMTLSGENGVSLYQNIYLNLEEETQINVAKKTANCKQPGAKMHCRLLEEGERKFNYVLWEEWIIFTLNSNAWPQDTDNGKPFQPPSWRRGGLRLVAHTKH